MTNDVLFFFSGAPEALGLFELLWERIAARWGDTSLKVQKTQITFLDPRGFCFASLRGRRLIVSFGLGHALQSPRFQAVSNPAPGRFTHHVAVRTADELDEELLSWIAQSHAFMAARLSRSAGN